MIKSFGFSFPSLRKYWFWITITFCSSSEKGAPCTSCIIETIAAPTLKPALNPSPCAIWTEWEPWRPSAAIEVLMVDCKFRQSGPLLHPRSVLLLLQHLHIQCLLIMRTEDSAPSSCRCVSPAINHCCWCHSGTISNIWIIYLIIHF